MFFPQEIPWSSPATFQLSEHPVHPYSFTQITQKGSFSNAEETNIQFARPADQAQEPLDPTTYKRVHYMV